VLLTRLRPGQRATVLQLPAPRGIDHRPHGTVRRGRPMRCAGSAREWGGIIRASGATAN
jgi:hypothetical protein